MSKKLVFLVVVLFTLAVLSGGCGGGSSSSSSSDTLPENPEEIQEDNPQKETPRETLLSDALEFGAEVSINVNWAEKEYTLKFVNIGNGEFALHDASSDLPFSILMSYGTEGFSALATDNEYSDIFVGYVVNVYESTYYVSFSRVLQQIWSNYNNIYGVVVNGKDFSDELEWEMQEVSSDVTPFFEFDVVSADNTVVTMNFSIDEQYYHYTWRQTPENIGYLCIDESKEYSLSIVNLTYLLGKLEATFTDENRGKWITFSFDGESKTYLIQSNAEKYSLDEIYVNGFDFTNQFTLMKSNGKSFLGDSLLKGAMVNFDVIWQGEHRSLDFVNIGNGKFKLLSEPKSATESISLSIIGSMLVGIILDGDNYLMYSFFFADDSYQFDSSNYRIGISRITVNGRDITDLLTEKN